MRFIRAILDSFVSENDSHSVAMKKAGLSLALFAFISVFFVAITDKLTANKIAENQKAMLLKALNEIIPQDSYDNDLLNNKIILKKADTGFINDTPVYLATQSNQPTTAIFEVTTNNGYSGAITLLVGVNATDNTITGVRVVKHKETPGLGDKMEIAKTPASKTPWVFDFNDKSLSNPKLERWLVKKDGGDFDQFTGATITPRAIVNAVKSTLLYAEENMDNLFSLESLNASVISQQQENN